MSHVIVHAIEPERQADLRGRAAARLTGRAASKGAIARAADALSVLHALASSPATADDALTLLHELQVHQVELDLQAQELLESRAELESALRRQMELYDSHPAGCYTVDARGALHELNQTGADMLGISRDDAWGCALDAFFCPRSAPRFRSLIASLDATRAESVDTRRPPTCLLTLRPKNGPEQTVLASIARDPAGDRCLVSLTSTADSPNLPSDLD
jgi:PAS domain-containing protein